MSMFDTLNFYDRLSSGILYGMGGIALGSAVLVVGLWMWRDMQK